MILNRLLSSQYLSRPKGRSLSPKLFIASNKIKAQQYNNSQVYRKDLKASNDVSLDNHSRAEIASIASKLGYEVIENSNDDEDETWDDAMEELEDPWMKNPAPSEALEHFSQDILKDGSGTSPSSPKTSSSRPIGEVVYVSLTDVEDLLKKNRLLKQKESLEIIQGKAEKPKEDFVIVLDVRSPENIIDSAKLSFLDAWNVPINDLSKYAILLTMAKTVVVLGTEESLLAAQACIRLTKVYRVQDVWFLENWS
uniref:Rhodanese domain-containing protein n=1 Tax=Polytomella parva TaxID=51329 RepID=A0A7S0UPM4_9CHLO